MIATERDELLAAIDAAGLTASDRDDIVGLVDSDQAGLARVALAGFYAVRAAVWPPTSVEQVVTDYGWHVHVDHHGHVLEVPGPVARLLPGIYSLADDDPLREEFRLATVPPDLCNRCRDRFASIGDHCTVCRGVLDDITDRRLP